MIEFVSATRRSLAEYHRSALGHSLRRLAYNPTLGSRVTIDNALGLPEIYNRAIEADNEHDILAFIHDDVWINDYLVGQRIVEGLKLFDVIGLAGNRRRQPGQTVWAFMGDRNELDGEYTSGALAHDPTPTGLVRSFGPYPAACEMLDGVFLAARKSTLRRLGVRFDPQFAFHFYDLDFCRTARQAGLRLGTWPIAMTHQSVGDFFAHSWEAARDLYFAKWGD